LRLEACRLGVGPIPVGLLWVSLALLAGCTDSGLPEGDPQAGKRIYWEGLTGEAEPVPALVQGDVQTQSDRFPCVGCHRPSGFGSSEGGQFVPPITQPVLFAASRSDRQRRNRRFRDLFKEEHDASFAARVRMPRMRPAYTEESLVRALREGDDPTGRPLNVAMPRYQFSDQAMADLVAYLKTLSRDLSPGVTQTELHLATVVTDSVTPERRRAVLDTARAFVRWYNKDTEGDLHNPGFSPFYRSDFKDAYRYWRLQVWELTGPPETWNRQLADYYQKRPVFALVSGLVDAPWAAVDGFCQARSLPCVFPNTQMPNLESPEYGYSLYFSRGLTLEAEVLAEHISAQSVRTGRLQQIYLNEPAGKVPARAFAQQMVDRSIELTSRAVDSEQALLAAVQAVDDPEFSLVVWPGSAGGALLSGLRRDAPRLNRLFLPASTLPAADQQLSGELRQSLRFSYPYEKPSGYHPRKYRVRGWMHSRGLEVTHPRLQLQTYYALTQTQFAIANLVDDFSRDYFIEFIERQAEAELNPGTHPSLSLGPGQRFASKGAYIMTLNPEVDGGFQAVSDWLVPR